MDLEKEILQLYYRNKHNPLFTYIEGETPLEGSLRKCWDNFFIGIEVKVEGNKSCYYLDYNNNVLALEVKHYEDHKEYSRYEVRLEDKLKQPVNRPTFKKYFNQFKEVIKLFELVNESKG